MHPVGQLRWVPWFQVVPYCAAEGSQLINEIHLFASLCGEYAAEVGFGALELVLRQDIELLLDTG